MFKMNDNMIKYDVFYLPLVCRGRAPPFCFPECTATTPHRTKGHQAGTYRNVVGYRDK